MLRGWPAPRPGGGERSRPLPPLCLGGARTTDRPPGGYPRGAPLLLEAPKGVEERVGRLGGLFLLKAAPPERGKGKAKLPCEGVLVYQGEGINYGTEDKENQAGGRVRQKENGRPTLQ